MSEGSYKSLYPFAFILLLKDASMGEKGGILSNKKWYPRTEEKLFPKSPLCLIAMFSYQKSRDGGV